MGKLSDDTLKWTLDVNGNPARKELNDVAQATRNLEKTNKSLRVEQQKMQAAGKKNTKEYKDLQKQIKLNNSTITANKIKMAGLRKEVGLNSLTARELRSEYKRLKNQMDNLDPNSKEWKDLNGQLGQVKGRMGELRTAGKKTNKMFGSLKSLLPVLGIGAVVSLVTNLGKEFLSLAIQLEGDSRRAAIVFGDSLKYVEQQADDLSKAMGLTNQEFVAAAANTSDLLIPLDFTRETAAKMAVELQSLAGALDEWTGGRLGAAEVSNILTKAMLGENEQLKQLGIAIRKDSDEYTDLVKQKLEATGVTKAQAEAMATLELIQRKSADAQTAYTQEGNKLLRTQKSLSRWWKQLKEDVVGYFDVPKSAEIMKERDNLNLLVNSIVSVNDKQKIRNSLIGKLQKSYPTFLQNLDAEKVSNEQLLKKLKEVNDEYKNRIKIAVYEEELTAIEEKNKNLFRLQEGHVEHINMLYDKHIKNKKEGLTLDEKLNALATEQLDYASLSVDQMTTAADAVQQIRFDAQTSMREVNSLAEQEIELETEYQKIAAKRADILPEEEGEEEGFTSSLDPAIDRYKNFVEENAESFEQWKLAREIYYQNIAEEERKLKERSEKAAGETFEFDEEGGLPDLADSPVINNALLEQEYLLEIYGETYQGRLDLLNESLEEGEISQREYADRVKLIYVEMGQEYYAIFAQAYNGINKVLTNLENQSLDNFKLQTEQKKSMLNKQLNSGVISYDQYTARINELDVKLDKEQRKRAHDQAVRNKALALLTAIINTAAGVTAQLSIPGAGIGLAILAGVLGAIEIAAIATEPVPQFAAGNFLDVIGASDGKKYKAAKGNGSTGFYSQPTMFPGLGLVGEGDGTEMVFNSSDTGKLLKSPQLIDAINYTISTPQFASGNSTEIIRETNNTTSFTDPALMALLVEVKAAFEKPSTAVLVANEDYLRTHNKEQDEYQSFQNKVN